MEDDALEVVAGTLMVHSFLLENLYARMFVTDSDPVGAADRVAADFMRQFAALPSPDGEEPPSDAAARVIKIGLLRLERFWASVEQRLQAQTERSPDE